MNFALWSTTATGVRGLPVRRERSRDAHTPRRDRPTTSGTATCPASAPGQRYGFRVDGPYDPARGLFHNPAKLLLDPYARAIEGDFVDHPAVYPDSPLDSAPYVPRSVVIHDAFPWGEDVRPRIAVGRHGDLRAARARVHAAAPGHPAGAARHLRRARPPGRDRVPAEPRRDRGRAAADPPLRLRAGAAAARDAQLLGLQLASASSRRTRRTRRAPGNQVREFKSMVRAMHAAGLEVILDVVYNHTAEAGPDGPVLSFRGIDNGVVLPARGGRSVALRRLHRLRQHLRPAPAVPAAADHRLVAVLDHRDARRRVPLRPRVGARTLAARRRQAVVVLRRHPPGSRHLAGETHRRAVGRRRRRLPGRRVPAAVDGVERQVPRHRPLVLGARRRTACATWRSGSPARPTSTATTAGCRSPRSTSSPRTTASPSATWSPTSASTTRRTARTTATAPTTTARYNCGVEGDPARAVGRRRCGCGRRATC